MYCIPEASCFVNLSLFRAINFCLYGRLVTMEILLSADSRLLRCASHCSKSYSDSCFCSDPVDIETLRRAAASKGGLLTNDVRRKVWPKLLNVNVYDLPPKPG